MFNTQLIQAELQTKQIIILGLGREGLSTYKFIRQLLPQQFILFVDEKDRAFLTDEWQEIINNDHNSKLVKNLEKLTENKQDNVVVFKTPGISPHHPLMKVVKQQKFEISSNLNLFFQLTQQVAQEKLKTIGVTGTKGKSTTSAIIHHLLKSCNFHSFLSGNIGTPALDVLPAIKDSLLNSNNKPVTVVLELSCHQLNDLKFSPEIAVLLNISPEHLDYYNSFQEYVIAKSHITKFQTNDDLVIFNSDYKVPRQIAQKSKAKQIAFNQTSNIVDNKLHYNNTDIINTNLLPLVGEHTIMNALPGVIIATQLGCTAPQIAQALTTFKSLPHRLELVADIAGVRYFNDSLSTTQESSVAAIQSFNNQPIILIAGGYDRGLSFDKLAEAILNHNIKHLILLPDTGHKIIEAINQRTNHEPQVKHTLVSSLQEAMKLVKQEVKSGDIVLMSPASASFNMFKNYQERGEIFAKLATADNPNFS